MTLYASQRQKAICKEDICASCGYAEIETTDSEYSCEEYVGDCVYPSHNSSFAENIVEQMLNYNTQRIRGYCPFWIPRFHKECELLRCPSCNSPEWQEVPNSIIQDEMTEKLKCRHCGEIRTEDLERVAYSSIDI